MPQNAIASNIAKNAANKFVALLADVTGTLLTSSGGISSALNITAAAAIKASAGRVAKIVIVAPGSAGSLTLNDAATTGAAATANQIITVGYAALAAGMVITLDWPCANGVTISAIPTGAQISVSYA